jgi:pilus assembly protein Flp/PilA
MKYLRRLCCDLLHGDGGQDLIEYALVAAMIALGATVAMKSLATAVGTSFTAISTKLNSAV